MHDDKPRIPASAITFPMVKEDAYQKLFPYLFEFEKNEIFNYDKIYYFNVAERQKGKQSSLLSNHTGGALSPDSNANNNNNGAPSAAS